MPRHALPGSGGVGAPSCADQASASPFAASPFDRFLLWERSSRDTLEVKRAYIDMAGDLVAGIMLSQIVYWHLPDRDGRSRLRIEREGKQWIARGRTDWWEECRISPKQADRALQALREKQLIETRLFRFNGAPTVHLRICHDAFIEAWRAVVEGTTDRSEPSDFPQTSKSISPDGQNPTSPKGENHLTDSGKSITETTAESTPERTTTAPGVVASVLDRLLEVGVSKDTASELLRSYNERRITQQLAMLPYRDAREPAAMLIKAIKEDWAPPASYIKAEERRLREDRLREEAEQRRRQQEREELARDTMRAIQDDYWDSLDPRQRMEINATVDRLFAERYPALVRTDTAHKSGRIMSLMKDELRRQILDERMGEKGEG